MLEISGIISGDLAVALGEAQVAEGRLVLVERFFEVLPVLAHFLFEF